MKTRHVRRSLLRRMLFACFIGGPLVGFTAESIPSSLKCSLHRLEQDPMGGDHWRKADEATLGSIDIDGQKWLVQGESTSAAGTHVTHSEQDTSGYVFYFLYAPPTKEIIYRVFVSMHDGRGLLYKGPWLVDEWNIPEYWVECALPAQ